MKSHIEIWTDSMDNEFGELDTLTHKIIGCLEDQFPEVNWNWSILPAEEE